MPRKPDVSTLVPEGSIGIWSTKRSGKCVVCGRKFRKKDIILRTAERKVVCKLDSPHISDEDIFLHGQPVTQWPRRRLLGLDADVQTFDGKTVSVNDRRYR